MKIRYGVLRSLIRESILGENRDKTPSTVAISNGYDVSKLEWDYDLCPRHRVPLQLFVRRKEDGAASSVGGAFFKCPEYKECGYTVSPGSGRPSGAYWNEERAELDPEAVFKDRKQAAAARSASYMQKRQELEAPYKNWLKMQPRAEDGVKLKKLFNKARDEFPDVFRNSKKTLSAFADDALTVGILHADDYKNMKRFGVIK